MTNCRRTRRTATLRRRADADAVAARDVQPARVLRIHLHIALGGVELPQHGRLRRPRLRVPLREPPRPVSRRSGILVVGLLGHRPGVLEDEPGPAVGW